MIEVDNNDYKKKLNKLIEKKTLPNLILHGQPKSTIFALKYLLKGLYPNMGKLLFDERIEKVNSKIIKIPIFYTNIHIEILVSDFGYNSRTLLPQLLIEIASTKNIMTQEHKVIVLHGVEELSKQTQYILRGNFEMIMKNCRVILLTKNVNKLIEPLQSRCLEVRVPNLFKIDNDIIKENNEDYQLYENIVDNMVKNLDKIPFSKVTEILYLLMSKNVPFEEIIKQTLVSIRNLSIDMERVYELAALYDDKMNISTRNFIHLQTFFIELMTLVE